MLSLPRASTQAATQEQARESLEQAVVLVLEANRTTAEKRLVDRPVIRERLCISA
jgi:predicted RNase H-like HicB family nuclease